MNDPMRLLEDGADDFEATLLRAGRADAPSRASRRRIAAGLGIGGGVISAFALMMQSKGWLSPFGAVTAAKVAGGSAVGALALWSGVQVYQSATEPEPPAPAAVVAPAPVVQRPSIAALEPPKAEPPAAPEISEPPAQKASAPRKASAAGDSLSRELAALELARGAIVRRDFALAERRLDEYARAFPKGRLATEATVLRIEARAGRGDRAGAARLGKALLARSPRGPYAKRVRSLIDEPQPEP